MNTQADTMKGDTLLASYLAQLTLGEVQQFKNMTVIPLLTAVNHSPEYFTLKEALEKNFLTVGEVSEGGSVPQLKVINLAELPVLLVDGEALAGAKQNRVLNASILLKEKTETVIPVSCSERGRWSYRSGQFSHSGHVMAYKLRKMKSSHVSESLKHSHGYSSDQGAIWSEVDALASHAKVHSPTSAMDDVYTAKMEELTAYLAGFKTVPGQKGLLVLINGEVAGLDIVSLERAYQVLHPSLLKSYAMDALLEQAEQTAAAVQEKAATFLAETVKCAESKFPSVGHGMDYRFDGGKVAGSALVADQKVIHLALYRC